MFLQHLYPGNVLQLKLNHFLICWNLIQVFHSLYKIGRNGIIGIKGFNNSKKVPYSGVRPDARDYYWFKNPMPNQLSQAGIGL